MEMTTSDGRTTVIKQGFKNSIVIQLGGDIDNSSSFININNDNNNNNNGHRGQVVEINQESPSMRLNQEEEIDDGLDDDDSGSPIVVGADEGFVVDYYQTDGGELDEEQTETPTTREDRQLRDHILEKIDHSSIDADALDILTEFYRAHNATAQPSPAQTASDSWARLILGVRAKSQHQNPRYGKEQIDKEATDSTAINHQEQRILASTPTTNASILASPFSMLSTLQAVQAQKLADIRAAAEQKKQATRNKKYSPSHMFRRFRRFICCHPLRPFSRGPSRVSFCCCPSATGRRSAKGHPDTTVLWRHLFLLIGIILYAVIGGLFFYHIEGSHEEAQTARRLAAARLEKQKSAFDDIDVVFKQNSTMTAPPNTTTVTTKPEIQETIDSEIEELLSLELGGSDLNETEAILNSMNISMIPEESPAPPLAPPTCVPITRKEENSIVEIGEKRWSFTNSIFFAFTIFTTIGYGHLAPETKLGMAFTIAYAIIGIPFMLIFVSTLGQTMLMAAQKITAKCSQFAMPWRKVKGSPVKPTETPAVRPATSGNTSADDASTKIPNHLSPELPNPAPVSVPPVSMEVRLAPAIITVVIYVFLSSVIYWWCDQNQKQWDYFQSVYFVFITLSTIGFGDITPKLKFRDIDGRLIDPLGTYMTMVLSILGLGLVSMLITIMQNRIEARYLKALKVMETAYQASLQTAINRKDAFHLHSRHNHLHLSQAARNRFIRKTAAKKQRQSNSATNGGFLRQTFMNMNIVHHCGGQHFSHQFHPTLNINNNNHHEVPGQSTTAVLRSISEPSAGGTNTAMLSNFKSISPTAAIVIDQDDNDGIIPGAKIPGNPPGKVNNNLKED